MTAPFLRERWGWVETDQCWGYRQGRQNWEHLFKECKRWKADFHLLWDKVGNISGKGNPGNKRERGSMDTLRSKRGLGYSVREAKARPSNTAVRELIGNGAYTEASLPFLRRAQGKSTQDFWIRAQGSAESLSFVAGHFSLWVTYGFLSLCRCKP